MAIRNLTPTRRDALSAFGVTGLAGIALAGLARPETLSTSRTASSDAILLQLAAAHRAVERQRDELADRWGDTNDDVPHSVEAEMAWLQHEAETFVEQISALPAHTRAGVAAKSAVAAGLIGSFGVDDLDPKDALVLSLCRDLQSGAAA